MKILEPITIGTVTLKNRLMFPPLTTGYEGRDGSITPQSFAFYERLAKGGTAYIVIGDVNSVTSFSPTPRLHDDSQIPGFARLADGIHNYGARLAIQIFYPEYDVEALVNMTGTGDMAGVRAKLHHDMEHFTDEVTEEKLMDIIDKMVECARRARKAGVDAIQIHGDRLVGTLCSTRMNHRTDRFGGSLENRVRFARMLTQAIRRAIPDMLLDYKFSVITPERGKGGIDLADAPQMAKWLQEDGVDMLHVAQANHTGNLADTIPPMGVQPYGFFVDIAGQIKQAVDIPVSCVGRVIDPYMAEGILNGGKADLVAVGRPLLCDPDWIVKLSIGKPETIRRCISCNKGCTDAIQNRQGLSCILNAENGHELERSIKQAEVAKRVAVVGGGPAGLEAARVAALCGHDVSLWEKSTSLGGQMSLASVPPRKDELRRAVDDLVSAVKDSNVTLHLGQEATVPVLLAHNPDAVILAVGAASFTPSIPGSTGALVCDAWQVLAGARNVHGTVVVIGGGQVGCETAEYLARQGSHVIIVEMLDKIAAGESNTVLPTMMAEFDRYGVERYTEVTVTKITDSQVQATGKDGSALVFPCDYVVMAAGARPVGFDAAQLEASGIAVTRIGDCAREVSDISNAIRTGYDAACAVSV